MLSIKRDHDSFAPLRAFLLGGLALFALLFSITGYTASLGEDTYFPFPETGNARGEVKGEWYALDERMTKIEKSAAEPGVDELQLRLWLKEIDELQKSVSSYVKILESQQEKLNSDLATLGEAGENEPQAVSEQRDQIEASRGELDGKLSGYRLLVLHSEQLHHKLTEQRQQLLTQHFFARGPSVVDLLKAQGALSWRWLGAAGQFISDNSGLQLLSDKQFAIMSGLLVVAMLLGMVLRGRSRRWCAKQRGGECRYTLLLYGALGHYAPHLLLAVVLALFVLASFVQPPYPFIYVLSLTLPLLFLVWVVLRTLFSEEGGVQAQYDLAPGLVRGIGRSLKLFVLLAYMGYLIFTTEVVKLMPEAGRFLSRDLFVTAMVITLLWGARYLHLALQQKGLRGFYGIALLVLLGALGAELLGYRNLSYWVLRAMLGTLFTFGVFLFLASLLKELFEGLKAGQLRWQSSLRTLLGYRRDEAMPWLGWLRLISLTMLWIGFTYVAMYIWGLSTDAIKVLYDYFFDGFLIGSLKVIPARIVIAIVVFAMLMAVSGWVRGRMEGQWLVKSRMDRGTREAMVTITGYLGVTVAILIALSVAGVQFTNLAIIAGALSVGIGFGLQNIVNNFVSGLILLFERPVKTGDWILVGNTEGYVKRIRIRSTLIQTFDRADVIVPNSELISGQVTNWMLYDPRGRIKVPIGIAYGSDTQLVHELLLKIAAEHPNVITDGSMTGPKVLFIGFGDSALNFELRAFVQNIDERLQIVSDINFAIDAAFREHGIEIPFPQRDLHVRHWPSPPAGNLPDA